MPFITSHPSVVAHESLITPSWVSLQLVICRLVSPEKLLLDHANALVEVTKSRTNPVIKVFYRCFCVFYRILQVTESVGGKPSHQCYQSRKYKSRNNKTKYVIGDFFCYSLVTITVAVSIAPSHYNSFLLQFDLA